MVSLSGTFINKTFARNLIKLESNSMSIKKTVLTALEIFRRCQRYV
jgi:hypothetical protein